MALARPADVPSDLLEEFRLDTADHLPRCEQLLIELERHPQDGTRLRELFRLVHTIKGSLGLVELNHLLPLPQAMEDVLDRLREGSLQFDSLLGDILLLSLDQLRNLIEAALGRAANPDPGQIASQCQALQALAAAPASRQTEIRRTLLQHLAPETRLQPVEVGHGQIPQLLADYGIEVDADLLFFIELMTTSEHRSPFWHGRGLRLLDLALGMNEVADRPVEPAQLAAAVCLHDLGMAFLPLDLLHKESELSREERRQMQSHPRQACELLKRMPAWNTASEIILQHQEHADGSGYPKGLRETEIHPGALLLNIADTFDARTHERAHQTMSKRPRLRAILEINNLSGMQFSGYWVEVFNRTLQLHPELAHR
ncbi:MULTISPECIES: HD domain-containing phosphohydrolase [unclassified Pseudomonas]|uniref:HD-GYP domain-containing protein n=1 Tax=unclassified Pseudomonas TaxID=196821 RepID=UPI00244D0E58|nr:MULTISPECIES: HD domain-containing phosphohydrolase [unclassified Pseudomonas]MDG9924946.1 Hpt domain-containing protein [Pseudomonas sp. GD04045]MDH0036227.1 Hpt domain-containing protein [Pseudomonas sp. GD04019]